MKKILSLLCAIVMLMGVLAVGTVGAAAADPAQTIVDVKSGDKVVYVLMLSDVPERVECADFSFYYDSNLLTLDQFLDYTNSEEDMVALVNTDLEGEVRGSFIYVKKKNSGVDFSQKRNFATLSFTAKGSGKAHISYYVRDMYGDTSVLNPVPIAQYTFTCSVSVNGSEVIENAEPELNTEENQPNGDFVNSVNGKGDDADVQIDKNGNNVAPNNESKQSDATKAPSDDQSKEPTDDAAPTEKDDSPATDSEVEPITTIGADDTAASRGSMTWLWIVIVIVVVLGGAGAALYLKKNKKK